MSAPVYLQQQTRQLGFQLQRSCLRALLCGAHPSRAAPCYTLRSFTCGERSVALWSCASRKFATHPANPRHSHHQQSHAACPPNCETNYHAAHGLYLRLAQEKRYAPFSLCRQHRQVHVTAEWCLACVDLEDLMPSSSIGGRHQQQPVKAAWPQQCGVHFVWPVGGRKHHHTQPRLHRLPHHKGVGVEVCMQAALVHVTCAAQEGHHQHMTQWSFAGSRGVAQTNQSPLGLKKLQRALNG